MIYGKKIWEKNVFNTAVIFGRDGKLLAQYDKVHPAVNEGTVGGNDFPIFEIEGWKIGIPLIKKGGKLKLIIPSALAYGCNDISGIPGNSILFFDIDLIDVQ